MIFISIVYKNTINLKKMKLISIVYKKWVRRIDRYHMVKKKEEKKTWHLQKPQSKRGKWERSKEMTSIHHFLPGRSGKTKEKTSFQCRVILMQSKGRSTEIDIHHDHFLNSILHFAECRSISKIRKQAKNNRIALAVWLHTNNDLLDPDRLKSAFRVSCVHMRRVNTDRFNKQAKRAITREMHDTSIHNTCSSHEFFWPQHLKEIAITRNTQTPTPLTASLCKIMCRQGTWQNLCTFWGTVNCDVQTSATRNSHAPVMQKHSRTAHESANSHNSQRPTTQTTKMRQDQVMTIYMTKMRHNYTPSAGMPKNLMARSLTNDREGKKAVPYSLLLDTNTCWI